MRKSNQRRTAIHCNCTHNVIQNDLKRQKNVKIQNKFRFSERASDTKCDLLKYGFAVNKTEIPSRYQLPFIAANEISEHIDSKLNDFFFSFVVPFVSSHSCGYVHSVSSDIFRKYNNVFQLATGRISSVVERTCFSEPGKDD